MARPHWWESLPDPDAEHYIAALDVELGRAQQVGEEVAAQMLDFAASRRELRRCDNSRPDLQIVG